VFAHDERFRAVALTKFQDGDKFEINGAEFLANFEDLASAQRTERKHMDSLAKERVGCVERCQTMHADLGQKNKQLQNHRLAAKG